MLSNFSETEIATITKDPTSEFYSFYPVEGENSEGLILSHFNFNTVISDLIKTNFPFTQVHREWFSRMRTDEEFDTPEYRQEWEAYQKVIAALPSEYGVCDYPQQLIEQFPILTTDSRRFIVIFTPIYKADQSEEGGWRWHKWGPYIGTQNPQHEYIADEPDIDMVYVYQIMELLP
jgi:hypothetical protein